jgi:hypothetical protein
MRSSSNSGAPALSAFCPRLCSRCNEYRFIVILSRSSQEQLPSKTKLRRDRERRPEHRERANKLKEVATLVLKSRMRPSIASTE